MEDKKTLGTDIPKLDESYLEDMKPLPEKQIDYTKI